MQAVNTTMVFTYFEIGRIIVEHEQQGEERAEYDKKTIKTLSCQLTKEFGKGFSTTNLERMRLFYIQYLKSATVLPISGKQEIISESSQSSDISKPSTVSRISQNNFTLSWSHLICIFHQRRSFKNK